MNQREQVVKDTELNYLEMAISFFKKVSSKILMVSTGIVYALIHHIYAKSPLRIPRFIEAYVCLPFFESSSAICRAFGKRSSLL
jgi:hypothetical protein